METSFDIEQARFGRKAQAIDMTRPVFVCGLARGGTSVVTRLIASGGRFATPSYRDMPFPLAPNSWRALTGGQSRAIDATERGHGDGLDHDLDSPEAIEEAFWRCHDGTEYIGRDSLAPHVPGGETIDAFRRYMALIALARGRDRYLSKNNNTVLRLPALAAAFPDAVFVHPFRDPVAQAGSLLAQHRRAVALQAGDRFRTDYMRWLGHHEFGADHRPFGLPGMPTDGDPMAIDYWRQGWDAVHRHLLDQLPDIAARQLFVDFEALRRDPIGQGARLIAATGAGAIDAGIVTPAPDRDGTADSAVLAELRARSVGTL